MDPEPDEPPSDPSLEHEARQVRRLATWSAMMGVLSFGSVFVAADTVIMPFLLAAPSITSAVWAKRRATLLPNPPSTTRAEIGSAFAISGVLLMIGALVLSGITAS